MHASRVGTKEKCNVQTAHLRFCLIVCVLVHYCDIRTNRSESASSRSFPVCELKTCCPNPPIDRMCATPGPRTVENYERAVCYRVDWIKSQIKATVPAIAAAIVQKRFEMKTRFIAVGFFPFRRIRFDLCPRPRPLSPSQHFIVT